ncbi:MAG: glucose-1-phosphatase, partial [bacterium P201]
VSEGLLPDNYRPEGDEVLFYANSRQRTFATAKYFSAGFLPFANVEITHKYDEDKMDPVFTPQFTKMNDTYRQQVLSEMEAMHGGPQTWMAAQQPTLTLMEEVLDIAHSPAAANDTTHFWYDDVQFKIEKGDEPKMTGGYTLANSVADALVLQCYESESFAPFGHALTTEQWRDICAVKEVYDALLFTTHSAAVNLAYPLVSRIREELNRSDRKFMFLCGHDSNLASIGAALGLQFPETENALELHTPIGSKLVFEKWSDGSEDYISQSNSCSIGHCSRPTCRRWCCPSPSMVSRPMPTASTTSATLMPAWPEPWLSMKPSKTCRPTSEPPQPSPPPLAAPTPSTVPPPPLPRVASSSKTNRKQLGNETDKETMDACRHHLRHGSIDIVQ